MRAFDRDLIRAGHYGQRSCETAPTGRTHGCTDQQRDVKISLANSGAVHTWHKSEVPERINDVRFRGQSGKHLLILSLSAYDPERTS
jgi:hypothetical protein